MTTPTLPPGYTPMLAAGVVAVRTPNGSLVGDAAAAWAHSLTPTLMTAAEMRAHLIERRRELEAQRALMEAEHAAQETERIKVWAPVQLAVMLDTLKQGTAEASTSAGDRVEMQAVVDLARSLGYEAAVEIGRFAGMAGASGREDEVFYAVVKAPGLEDAAPVKMRVHCDEYHAHRDSCMVPDEGAA